MSVRVEARLFKVQRNSSLSHPLFNLRSLKCLVHNFEGVLFSLGDDLVEFRCICVHHSRVEFIERL